MTTTGLEQPLMCFANPKNVAREGPEVIEKMAYLFRLSSLLSGGRTTRRPSTGKNLNSIENPGPSLCGKAARS